MNPALRVEVADTCGHTAVLTLTGELDLYTAETLYNSVADVLDHQRTVILELTGVTFSDSSGFNILLRLRRRAQDRHADLVLAAPPPHLVAVAFVLDGGPCEVGVESTIVDATGDALSVLRPGGVTREDLEEVLGCALAVPSTSRVRVPGQHPSHYAPRARVVLVEPEKVVAEAELAQELGHQVGVLLPPSFADTAVKVHAGVALPASMATYARGLYAFLRELDQRGCDLIVASLPVEEGLGLAIANRLRRAAGPPPT
ncbi:Sua5 family C-terminal domain-containing protein [Streptomyces mirabilis]|uniref:Sua5 family C-terminal domain-containing protein n=1 Tax=Streptomyces mirabilis TaxID=68239 RepID=UPI00331B18F8